MLANMIVIKFWISSRVFFQQNNKLVNWKQSDKAYTLSFRKMS